MENSSRPFDGLTVIEIGQFVVVPVAATHLAHGGARVIKIEPAQGDSYRRLHPIAPHESRQYVVKNRGKESVSLKIGHPATDEILRRLFEIADVVLTNMSPGALQRHGLDDASVRAVNPRVIYGAVSGFGHVGPEAGLPGMDIVASARSGLMMALGAEADGIPLHSEVQTTDYSTSMLLLAGIATALYARERTGEGQTVEVSLLAGALSLQGNTAHHFHDHDPWRKTFVETELPKLRSEGATPSQIAARRDSMRADSGLQRGTYRVVRTADGFVAIGAGSPAARARTFDVAGVVEDYEADPGDVIAELDSAFAARPTKHWLEKLRAAEVPIAEARQIEELMFDEHVMAEGLMVDVDDDVVGPYRTLGAPIRLSSTPFVATARSPRFAANTRAVLEQLGYSEDQIKELAAAGVITVAEPLP